MLVSFEDYLSIIFHEPKVYIINESRANRIEDTDNPESAVYANIHGKDNKIKYWKYVNKELETTNPPEYDRRLNKFVSKLRLHGYDRIYDQRYKSSRKRAERLGEHSYLLSMQKHAARVGLDSLFNEIIKREIGDERFQEINDLYNQDFIKKLIDADPTNRDVIISHINVKRQFTGTEYSNIIKALRDELEPEITSRLNDLRGDSDLESQMDKVNPNKFIKVKYVDAKGSENEFSLDPEDTLSRRMEILAKAVDSLPKAKKDYLTNKFKSVYTDIVKRLDNMGSMTGEDKAAQRNYTAALYATHLIAQLMKPKKQAAPVP